MPASSGNQAAQAPDYLSYNQLVAQQQAKKKKTGPVGTKVIAPGSTTPNITTSTQEPSAAGPANATVSTDIDPVTGAVVGADLLGTGGGSLIGNRLKRKDVSIIGGL